LENLGIKRMSSSDRVNLYRIEIWSAGRSNAIFYTFWTVFILLSLIAFSGMFIARWNRSPIKERGQSRYFILVFVFAFVGMTLGWSFLNLIPWNVQFCAPVLIVLAIFQPLFFYAMFSRLYEYYYHNTLVQQQLAFAQSTRDTGVFDEAANQKVQRCHVWRKRMHYASIAVAVYTLALVLSSFQQRMHGKFHWAQMALWIQPVPIFLLLFHQL
jgi:hypothetical protein